MPRAATVAAVTLVAAVAAAAASAAAEAVAASRAAVTAAVAEGGDESPVLQCLSMALQHRWQTPPCVGRMDVLKNGQYTFLYYPF